MRCSLTPPRWADTPSIEGCSSREAQGPHTPPLLVSWQGFFVAFIYCFCNGEVSGKSEELSSLFQPQAVITRAKSSDPSLSIGFGGKEGKGKGKGREERREKGKARQGRAVLLSLGSAAPSALPGAGRDQEGSCPEAPGAALGAAGAARELLLRRPGLPGPAGPGGERGGRHPGAAAPGPAPPARLHPRLRHLPRAGAEPEGPRGKHGGFDRAHSVSPQAQQGAGDDAVKKRVDFPPGHADVPARMLILTLRALFTLAWRARAGIAARTTQLPFHQNQGAKGPRTLAPPPSWPKNKP